MRHEAHNVVPLQPRQPVPGDFDALMRAFDHHLAAANYARRTRDAYARDLALFAAFLDERFGIALVQLVNERHVDQWLQELVLARGNRDTTAARRLASIKRFYRWLKLCEYVQHDPTRAAQVRVHHRPVIAPEQGELLQVIERIPREGRFHIRDRAMLRLIFDAALRAGDVVKLEAPGQGALNTVDLERGWVRVAGKGGDVHTISIGTTTCSALERWLSVRLYQDARWLFPGAGGRQMTRQAVYHRCILRGRQAGLDQLHPHLFRHRRLGDIIEALGLDAARHHARHRSRATTAHVYGQHADAVVRENIREHCSLGGRP